MTAWRLFATLGDILPQRTKVAVVVLPQVGLSDPSRKALDVYHPAVVNAKLSDTSRDIICIEKHATVFPDRLARIGLFRPIRCWTKNDLKPTCSRWGCSPWSCSLV